MLMWIGRALTRAFELKRIDRKAHDRTRAQGCEMVGHTDHRAVWRIRAPGLPDGFMTAISGNGNRDKHVVHVDTELFYRAWLATTPTHWTPREEDCVVRAEMPKARLYSVAHSRFVHSSRKPVPLAEAIVWVERGTLRVGVVSGITSAFWLIANRAPSFPVEVQGYDSATRLYESVGCGPAPLSFKNLFEFEAGVDDRQYRSGWR